MSLDQADSITADPAEELIGRVQALQSDLAGISDPRARQLSEELLGAVIELYGEGMRRIVGALEDEGTRADGLRERLAADGVVASLLLIHDLYPVPLAERVQQGLDEIRPYLDSHGGGVEMLGIEDGVARIRLEGSCKTCPASSATLELAVKQALDEAAPDLEGLIVEGIQESEPEPDPTGLELPVVQVKANGAEPEMSKAAAAQAALSQEAAMVGWRRLDEAGSVAEGQVRSLTIAENQLAVARVEGTLLAFRDACAVCGAAISHGTLLGGQLACPSCGNSYDLPRAGRTADGGAQLEPVPLLAEEAGVRVALAS